jgi:hypothetical protein
MSCCNNCNTSPCCCASPLRYKGPNVDCVGLATNQTYDVILQNFANEICDLINSTEDVQGLDHVSFTSSTGSPSTAPNQPCETDTYTFWGDAGETINLGTFTILNPCGSDDYADVAWVDLFWGNDSTGQAGRFDLPFATITAALAASPFVFLRRGTYTESFLLVDGMVVYAEPGVEFIQGGIEHSLNTNISGSFLGYARFISNSVPALLINNGTLRFECDFIDNINTAFYVAGNATLTASANYIRCAGAGSGFVCSFRDSCTVELNVKEFCEGFHSPYFFRSQNDKQFKGSAKIVCPISRTLEGGPYGAMRKSVLNIGSNSDANIELVGNLECANTTPDVNAEVGCVSFYNATVGFQVNPTVIDITGDIFGGIEVGIYNGRSGLYKDLTVAGNIKSNISPMVIQNANRSNVDIKMKFLNSLIQGGQPTFIGQGVEVYFYNSSFYNSTIDSDVIDINDTGSNNTNVWLYNCVGEGTGGGSFIADNVIGFPFTVGLTFSNSNRPLDLGVVDAWGGFSQIPNLVVPKL